MSRPYAAGAGSLAAISLLVTAVCFSACSRPSAFDAADLEAWSVETEPTLVIGQLEGDSAYLFQRVSDAAFLPDGRIAVADRASIRIYDGGGDFLAQMGGEGEGPGEFALLRDIWVVPPDTVGAWDSDNLRLTYYTAEGTLARTVRLEPSRESAGVGRLDLMVGALDDGSVAIGSITAGSDGGTGHDRISVERFGPEGEHMERVTEVTGFIRGPSGPGPFSPYPYFAVHDRGIHFTSGETPTVHSWDVGQQAATGASRSVTFPAAENDAEAAWDALPEILAERGDGMYDYFLERAERSDSIPHLAGLLVDDAGRVWTKRYEAPSDALWLDGGARVRGGVWWVADATGRLVATAALPDGLIPLQVVGDRLLGLTVDELGVERVQLHGVRRGG